MTMIISLSIDVTQVDKSRLKRVTRKNGKDAIFLNLVLMETPTNEYGDFIVKQDLSKDERLKGVKLPILGNGRHMTPKVESPSPDSGEPSVPAEVGGDDVPF